MTFIRLNLVLTPSEIILMLPWKIEIVAMEKEMEKIASAKKLSLTQDYNKELSDYLEKLKNESYSKQYKYRTFVCLIACLKIG